MNAIIICALLILACALLVFQVWSADQYRTQMKAIDDKVQSIQWPVKQ